MTNAELLAVAVELYESLDEVHWNGAGFTGRLRFVHAWIPQLLALEGSSALRVRHADRSYVVNRLTSVVGEGELIDVAVEPPQLPDAFFAQTVDELLDRFEFRYKAPASFYIAETRFRYPQHEPTQDISRYLGALELVKLLRLISDHEETRSRLVWLILLRPEGKVEIPVVYSAADLQELDDLDALSLAVLSPPHETVKHSLLRNAVAETVAPAETMQRFRLLLRQFRETQQRYKDNFELYLTDFSFETQKEKLDAQKREYMLKLNNAIGEIHTKLIAIPAAVVLVGGQMKPVDSTASLVSNVVLLLGAVAFAVLMYMMTANQRHSLDAVNTDLQQRRKRLQFEIPNLFSDIAGAFTQLDERYRHQMKLLRWINGLVVAGLVCSVAVFTFYIVQGEKKSDQQPSIATSPGSAPHSQRAPVDSASNTSSAGTPRASPLRNRP